MSFTYNNTVIDVDMYLKSFYFMYYVKQDHCRGIYLPPSITGEEIPFQDIHNFSFSAKIQDDVFPLGTEYCCNTLWIKNSLEIALSLTILKIFSIFIFC